MPYLTCPNCGSSVTDAAVTPLACPSCCATLHPAEGLPLARPRRPKPLVRMPIGRDHGAPAAARAAIGELRDDLGEARFRACELLVSELVTNVVRHAPGRSAWGAADMRVRVYPDRVRIEVRDDGPGFTPHERADGQDPGSGWGLHIVREMSDDWGIEPGLQNCVWFELARTPLASGVHAAAH